MAKKIVDGVEFLEDGNGGLVPVSAIKPIDLKRQDDNPPLRDGQNPSRRAENQNHNAALNRQGAAHHERNLRLLSQ